MLVNQVVPLVARGLLRHSVRQCGLVGGPATASTTVRHQSDAAAVRLSDTDGEDGKPQQTDDSELSRRDFRFIFPEFLPDPNPEWRNSLAEKLYRRDMLNRRDQIEIPEFYVGSSLAVTCADENSPHPNKVSRFVGKCIDRGGTGLRAWFTLRNVIEGEGIEFMYQMYNPSVLKIEVLRLEKSIDEELYYLRDAPPEYSQVAFDMEPEILPEGAPVPINKTVVPLNPKPWNRAWQKYIDILYKGYSLTDPFPTPSKVRKQMRWMARNNVGWQLQTLKFDMMRDYRNTVPVEDQDKIWEEVGDRLEARDSQMRRVATKRAFVRPTKKL